MRQCGSLQFRFGDLGPRLRKGKLASVDAATLRLGALIKREPARADKTDLHWLNRLLILESNCTPFHRAMTFLR